MRPSPPTWQEAGWGGGGLPAANYTTDDGFGGGILGSLYRYDGVTSPYRWSLTVLLFTTSKGIHSHKVQFDILDLLDGKLGVRQAELRWWFVRLRVARMPLDLTHLAFVDIGHVAGAWDDMFGSPVAAGEGAGVRIAFGESFVLRGDAGCSAVEDRRMGVHMDVDNLF
jgi:hypothetical protein